MRRRTVLITGASSGLGSEAAVKLARLGANVVMVARDAQPGEAARERETTPDSLEWTFAPKESARVSSHQWRLATRPSVCG